MYPQLTVPDIARFWSHVDQSGGPDACWPWTAARTRYGHGVFKVKGRMLRASRVAWALVTDTPIPDSLYACHNCPGGDRPECVNPSHLFIGTNADNQQDAVKKGRIAVGDESWASLHRETLVQGIRQHFKEHSGARAGEQNSHARLTELDVKDIRLKFSLGKATRADLAREHGVTWTQIDWIIKRKSWTHV